MNFALKVRSDRSELKCHCETYIQQLFIISEVFWNNRFGSSLCVCVCVWGGVPPLHEWFRRGRQYVCWHGDWSLRQYCQFVLPVFKEINASRLDLCFLVFSGTTAFWKSVTNYADPPPQNCPNSRIPKAQPVVTWSLNNYKQPFIMVQLMHLLVIKH
jgi:hypothetical protein